MIKELLKPIFTMNKYFFIIIALIAVGCKHKVPNSIVPYSIKTTYFNDGHRETRLHEEWFDSSGKMLKTINFGTRIGDTVNIVNYVYNGELLVNIITQKPDGKLISNLCNFYTLGKRSGAAFIQGNDTLTKTIYNYYDDGSLMREIISYPLTKINPITVVKLYDVHGNIENIYNQIYEDSTKLVWSRYEMQSFNNRYNEAGLLTQTNTTMLFGYYEITDTISTVQFRYNTNNMIAAKVNTRKAVNDNTDSVAYIYNNQNLLEQAITYFSPIKKAAPLTDTAFYTYDSKNRLVVQMNSLKGTGYRFHYSDN